MQEVKRGQYLMLILKPVHDQASRQSRHNVLHRMDIFFLLKNRTRLIVRTHLGILQRIIPNF